MISGKTVSGIRIRKNKEITKKYLEFVQDLFVMDPTLKEAFEKGHGIIKIRQMFLQNLNETNGMNLLAIDEELSKKFADIKLDPVFNMFLFQLPPLDVVRQPYSTHWLLYSLNGFIFKMITSQRMPN